MKACMCILAGTKACDNCRNGPSKLFTTFVPTIPIEEEKKDITKVFTWTTTSISKNIKKE